VYLLAQAARRLSARVSRNARGSEPAVATVAG
jgi:hypothetical protein